MYFTPDYREWEDLALAGRAPPAVAPQLSAEGGATRSAELFDRARRVLVGGVNSPVRAMRAIGRDPVFIARAEGPHVWDADGNRYVNLLSTWGPAILGHTPPAVVRALEDALPLGTSYGAPTEREVLLRRGRLRGGPVGRALRMTSSGSEAVMGALRLARAADRARRRS